MRVFRFDLIALRNQLELRGVGDDARSTARFGPRSVTDCLAGFSSAPSGTIVT
jgi:hypothetical protein